MSNIHGELSHEIEVPCLSGGMTVVIGLEGEGERLTKRFMKCRKCRMVGYTARSSLSKLMCCTWSAGCSFLESRQLATRSTFAGLLLRCGRRHLWQCKLGHHGVDDGAWWPGL